MNDIEVEFGNSLYQPMLDRYIAGENVPFTEIQKVWRKMGQPASGASGFSAGEMVAAFAEENNLATKIGAKTPGRLLSGSAFKAGFGYIVGLPVAAYLTRQGKLIEGRDVTPGVSIS